MPLPKERQQIIQSRWLVPLAFLLLLNSGCRQEQLPPTTDPPVIDSLPFFRSADLSTLPEALSAGAVFRDTTGTPADPVALLQAAGMNTVRLRLFYHPLTPWQGTDSVAAFAGRLRSRGLKVWLTIHYSDTWADPTHQTPPAAWSQLNFSQLSDSVFAYTSRAVAAIQPDVVQIGNEINSGLLWPQGHLYHAADMAELLTRGCQAAKTALPSAQTMIHFAGQTGSRAFFDTLTRHQVPYDLIGLSFYPLWHGKSLSALEDTLRTLKTRTGKPVLVAETAYPFSLGWNDWTHNVVGDTSSLIPGFPATPGGQAAFLDSLRARVAAAGGSGWSYWEPAWTAFRGNSAPDGSPWENQAFFDFQGVALPAIRTMGH